MCACVRDCEIACVRVRACVLACARVCVSVFACLMHCLKNTHITLQATNNNKASATTKLKEVLGNGPQPGASAPKLGHPPFASGGNVVPKTASACSQQSLSRNKPAQSFSEGCSNTPLATGKVDVWSCEVLCWGGGGVVLPLEDVAVSKIPL